MIILLLIEATLALIVFCADSVGEEKRPRGERVARAVLWVVTLMTWFTHRNLMKLGRFGAVVWFLVTTGWLLTLLYDRMPAAVFFVVAEATMGFVVYCVDALTSRTSPHVGSCAACSGSSPLPDSSPTTTASPSSLPA